MALITEDGTNVTGAESYQTVAGADTYHSNLGNATWAALTTTVKEQLLRKATQYMTQMYRNRWKGYRTYSDQALDWPRQFVLVDDSLYNEEIESDEIPVEIKNACAELALKSNSVTLNPDIERQTASVTVASLSVTYVPGSPQNKKFTAIDMMLKPYLKNSGGGLQVIRA